MLEKLKNWLNGRFSKSPYASTDRLKKTGTQFAVRPNKAAVPSLQQKINRENNQDQNDKVLTRNRYVREETGTHETFKIIDASLEDVGEEVSFDPYNTGGFDRSKNWNTRS
jgi:hypothetical protein